MKSTLPTWNLAHKKVILRADLNVPLDQREIVDDFRLSALAPTLDYILNHNGSVILLTHLGRPTGYDQQLSTQRLLPWFQKHGYTVTFASNMDEATKLAQTLLPKTILLLENLRFFKEEQQRSVPFADRIARLGDYYVNDGFGVLHRNDSSVTLVPELFSKKDKTIGFLVEQELKNLNSLVQNPKHPFVCIMGGAKIADKIPLIDGLLSVADAILLCPALVFTFMKAQGKEIGASYVDDKVLDRCKAILAHPRAHLIQFPVDYLASESSLDGPYITVGANQFKQKTVGIAIGPKTVAQYQEQIMKAGTVFYNGAQGFIDKQETMKPFEQLVQAMKKSSAQTIIAGGDSVAAMRSMGSADNIYLSTGGGAALAYLARKPLPGLAALQQSGN